MVEIDTVDMNTINKKQRKTADQELYFSERDGRVCYNYNENNNIG